MSASAHGWKEMFSRGFRVSSPVSAMVRPLGVICGVRILLQTWPGRIKCPGCMPRVALCPAQEQEGFNSLLSGGSCAGNSCLALFIGDGTG